MLNQHECGRRGPDEGNNDDTASGTTDDCKHDNQYTCNQGLACGYRLGAGGRGQGAGGDAGAGGPSRPHPH